MNVTRTSHINRPNSNGSHRLQSPYSHPARMRTPNTVMAEELAANAAHVNPDDDPRIAQFNHRYIATLSRLDSLFAQQDNPVVQSNADSQLPDAPELAPDSATIQSEPKRLARTIDDDYGDDDDDEEEQEKEPAIKVKTATTISPSHSLPTPASSVASLTRKPPTLQPTSSSLSSSHGKSVEDVRKKLQEEKQAAEEQAKQEFNTIFYTLENDKRAMLEQQRLDELDRQVESETAGEQAGQANNAAATQQGTLSSANLGATSLMLKHLLARIDSKRNLVSAQDSQLRRLISEVRKNRSKWANEDKVGQEELYEAAERVLQELKAMTESSGPFLQKVNKREAPDYYNVIKHPMDIGTMQKKLKNLQYKSRQDFVADLYLIWNNCLKYNSHGEHPLRKKALIMMKHTDRLVILIPDITIRDRAEVEAEERRAALASEQDAEGVDDSEDDMPIKASRGRKAPGKGTKGTNARKAPPAAKEGTPASDVKPLLNGLREESHRADSNAPADINGAGSPPPGANDASQTDAMDVDHSIVNGDLNAETFEDPELDDFSARLWKSTTKKARAQVAAERHRLFGAHKINPEETAIFRTKAGMRRYMRQQQQLTQDPNNEQAKADSNGKPQAQVLPGQSLAEGMEEDGDSAYLPEYYDPVSGIPEINPRLTWDEDEDGNLISHADECLRLLPDGLFKSPESRLTKKLEANMKQMQDTRKVCAKIGIVKQMQIQTQMYQNQFNKYEPEPFVEADIEPQVVTDEDPLIAPWVCRAALQRSIGKICYHTGFEEAQPSALEAITDVTVDFINRLVGTIKTYSEAPRVPKPVSATPIADGESAYKSRYSFEQVMLHSLEHMGVDLPALETYVKEDLDRAGTKLVVMHDRMRSHLAELLRPALDPNTAGQDGVGAFNDGSEQFVGGDFAEDIDEDFFGFKELGLDRELGLESLSVPLHLLQNRMRNAYQSNNPSNSTMSGDLMPEPTVFVPITLETLKTEIGLVQDFFLNKLANQHPSHPGPGLIEDDELPIKQRFPKPRLPPTGKITSPRKRPLREQQQAAKKKRKLEAQAMEHSLSNGGAVPAVDLNGMDVNGHHRGINGVNGTRPILKATGKLKLEMPPPPLHGINGFMDPEKEDENSGMMSPESM